MTYAARQRIGCSRESVGTECRHAALEFMRGVAEGWSKADLAVWLLGPYAFATRHAPRDDRASTSAFHPIERASLEELLVGTRMQILTSLELAVLAGGTLDTIEDALIERHVRRLTDANGKIAWVPVDMARMHLEDRVSSLFVADYLNRPDNYQHLHVCHLCEAVTFDEETKELGRCSAHRASSLRLRRPLMNAV